MTDLPDAAADTSDAAGANAAATAPVLVLDTNVVLDWLYFRDPRCTDLADAITAGHVRWVASAAMRDELAHVLGRGIRGDRRGDNVRILETWDRWVRHADAGGAPAPHNLRCTDADDQKFLDLAVQVRASALLSADRAVLKLARRARTIGLSIVDLDGWTRQWRPAAGLTSPA